MHPSIVPTTDVSDDRPDVFRLRRRALFLICRKLGWSDIQQSTPAKDMRERLMGAGINVQIFNIPQLNKEYMDSLREADGGHTHVTEEITFPKIPEPTQETLEQSQEPDFESLKIFEIKKLCKKCGIKTQRTDKKPVLVAKLKAHVETLRNGENTAQRG